MQEQGCKTKSCEIEASRAGGGQAPGTLHHIICRVISVNYNSPVVKDLKSLDRYAYTGHSIIMGKRKNPWQDIDSVLQLFGKSQYAARKKNRDFVEKGIGRGRNPEMTGGGLLRSIGGWGVLKQKFLALKKTKCLSPENSPIGYVPVVFWPAGRFEIWA
ncbi:MAG: hypothetical protein KKD12_01840 [Proteobacteria bacterium]|nr:hypothetical protein [Pseudomonadota bacterium]